MRENCPSGLMRDGARRSLASCLFNPSVPPTLLTPIFAERYGAFYLADFASAARPASSIAFSMLAEVSTSRILSLRSSR